MSRAKKPAKTKGKRAQDYERFEKLTKALVAVPKSEIRAEIEKHEKAKKSRSSA